MNLNKQPKHRSNGSSPRPPRFSIGEEVRGYRVAELNGRGKIDCYGREWLYVVVCGRCGNARTVSQTHLRYFELGRRTMECRCKAPPSIAAGEPRAWILPPDWPVPPSLVPAR